VTGPDGAASQFLGHPSDAEMEAMLLRRYQKPIKFGRGEGKLAYPDNPGPCHARKRCRP
jgi:hypothetical protein